LLANTSETTYTNSESESGTYKYYVTAVYDEGESNASNTVTVDILTDINESISNKTDLYPNPASQIVNIVSEYFIESVVVYNYIGREVFVELINNTTYSIKTSEFESGIYLFQIQTDKGRITKKLIIK
jgi:hypothetical protein